MSSAIIYHRIDMDGVCSMALAYLYEFMRDKDQPIHIYGYNHSDDVADVEAFLTSVENVDRIYMLDITLSDHLLDKYAEKIIAIDHHDTAIPRCEPYLDRFQRHCVRLNHPYVYDTTGAVAAKAAACELTFATLFANWQMPRIVKLCGRYDVWDNQNEDILVFNDYCRYTNTTNINYNNVESNWFVNIIVNIFDTAYEIDNIISKHRTRYRLIQELDAIDCKSTAAEYEFIGAGYKVLVANRGNKNSKYFDCLWDKTKHDAMIMFKYVNDNSPKWSVSIYNDKDTDLQKIFDVILANENNKIISHGGHMQLACGYVTTDIHEDLLKHLLLIK